LLWLRTCGARHSDVDVHTVFVVEFGRHSECRLTVASVITKKEPANIKHSFHIKISNLLLLWHYSLHQVYIVSEKGVFCFLASF